MSDELQKYLAYAFCSLLYTAIVAVLIILQKNFFYIDYKSRPLFIKIYKAMAVIFPMTFSIVCSKWLNDHPGTFLSFFILVIIPCSVWYTVTFITCQAGREKYMKEMKAKDFEEKQRIEQEKQDIRNHFNQQLEEMKQKHTQAIKSLEEELSTVDQAHQNALHDLECKNHILEIKNKRLSEVVVFSQHMEALLENKSKSFLELYRALQADESLVDGRFPNEETFMLLACPEDQIRRTVPSMYDYFREYIIPKGYEDNVTVMMPSKIDSDKLTFIDFKKPPDALESDIFRHGKSVAGIAWATGEMIIIPDKEEEINRTDRPCLYSVAPGPHKETKGSLICYPVFDRELYKTEQKDSLICMINITSKMPNNFAYEDKKQYKLILDSVAKRIRFENRVKLIKELIARSREGVV